VKGKVFINTVEHIVQFDQGSREEPVERIWYDGGEQETSKYRTHLGMKQSKNAPTQLFPHKEAICGSNDEPVPVNIPCQNYSESEIKDTSAPLLTTSVMKYHKA